MKTLKFFFIFALSVVAFSSCSKEDVTKEETVDMAAEVQGTYQGTVIATDMLVLDTYEIKVTKVSNNQIQVSGDGITTLTTEIKPEENPEGMHYVSPWQLVDQYVVTYWIAEGELVLYLADGDVNFVGEKQ